MSIHIKTPDEIEQMYSAGQVVRRVLDRLGEMVEAGITTKQLNAEAIKLTHSAGAVCLFQGVPSNYGGIPFPGAICASRNEAVVHGIPCDSPLQDGDILSVDFGVKLNGWCGDSARTYCVGDVAPKTKKLVEVTRASLDIAICLVKPGERWSTVAGAMSDFVRASGFSVVEEFVGHGIGREMHEDPKVPNFVTRELRRSDIRLRSGMVLAVEPMVNSGTKKVEIENDGWTVVTKDRQPSAHWEHTLAVTDRGVRVLTA